MTRPAVVREAVAADHEAIHRLEPSLMGGEAWGRETLEQELVGADRVLLVAEQDGAIVGWALTRVLGDLGDLLRIAVHPDHRRQGLAARLLAASLEHAEAAGAEQVLLEVSEANAAAWAAYRAAGFEEIHRRRRYYRDGSTAVVLRWSRVSHVAL